MRGIYIEATQTEIDNLDWLAERGLAAVGLDLLLRYIREGYHLIGTPCRVCSATLLVSEVLPKIPCINCGEVY